MLDAIQPTLRMNPKGAEYKLKRIDDDDARPIRLHAADATGIAFVYAPTSDTYYLPWHQVATLTSKYPAR